MFRAPVVPRRPAAGAELGGDEHPRGRGEDEVHSPQEEAGDNRPRLPAGPPQASSRQKIFQPGTKIFEAAGPAGRPAADGAGERGEGGGRRGERGRDGHREEAPGGDCRVTVTSVSVSM